VGVYDDLNAEAEQQSIDDTRTRRTTTRASQTTAQRVSSIRSEYPWLTPGAAMSLAKAGHDGRSRATREAARRAAERKKKKGFGWHSIGDRVGAVGDWLVPETVEDIIGASLKVHTKWGKGATRAGFTALDFGEEAIASTFRRTAGNVLPTTIPHGSRQSTSTGLTRGDPGFNPLGGTKLGIIGEKLLDDGLKADIDLGSGFFPGGEIAAKQAERARAELSIAGQAATPGRLLAYTIAEPGSTEYKWASGLTDAAFVLYTDPATHGLSVAGKLRSARHLFDPSIAGAIRGATRRTAVTDLANAYLDSKDGRKVVDWLTTESSPYKIYKAMGEKISAEEAADLSRLSDAVDIVDYIRPKLGTSIRAKPYVANPLTRAVKPVDGYASYLPESVRKRVDGVRLTHIMPGAHVDPNNSTDVAVNMMRAAHNAKLGADKAEEYFNLAAAAKSPIGRFNAVNTVQSDIAATLLQGGTGRKVARGLTKMYENYVEHATAYYTDDIGHNVPVLGAIIRGQDYALPTPHLWSEYINRAIPLPDARAIRRATSKYGRVLNHWQTENASRPVPVALLDFVFQDVWKPMQLIRGAWTVRVVGEEQIRMAAMGQKSIINHPIQAIAWAIGRRGHTDALGKHFDPTDDATELAQALTRRGDNWRDRRMRWAQTNVRQGSEAYGEAGARELAKLHADPITRRLVAGLGDGDGVATVTGNPLVDVKEWFWSGAGQKFRKEMAEAKGRELLAVDRSVADELIDSMWQRVQTKTAGRADLLEVIGSGSLNGAPVLAKTSRGFDAADTLKTHLDDLGLQQAGPSTYVGELTRADRRGITSDIGLDGAVDSLFNVFMSRPTNFLSRSPAFRQFYWQRVEELLPAMDEAAQAKILAAARQANLPAKTLRRIEKTVDRKLLGELSLDDADTLAKAFGLDETKRLLYDLSERSQLFDITRHIFPFGEAWGEVLKVWARIITERPQNIRKAQLTIEGARGSGFFTTDENGEEWFNYPGSRFITEQVAGVPVQMRGRVQGLNIFSNNPLMPGVGPMVQIPASYFLPRKSSWNTVREMLLPFGDETLEGGALETFLPAWMQKFRQAGKTPFGREDQRLWDSTYMEAHRYLRGTGDYQSDEALDAAATKAANRIYALRGAAQFFAPSAPSPEFMARDKNGRLMVATKLTEEFRKLLDEDVKNDTDTAVEIFLNKYGPDALEYMQNKSEGGGPTSSKALDWINDNAAFVKRYPDTYALFAPQDEGFDYEAYTTLIRLGTVRPLKPKEFVEMANARVAAMIYRQAQAAVEDADPDEATVWLREIKQELTREYPGYNRKPFDDKKVPNQIRELAAAIDEPTVSSTPVARGIRAYMEQRQLAQEEAEARGLAGFGTAKSAADLREWLREWGAEYAKKYRGFDEVFNRVFVRELKKEDAE
jgi:hypothetical protein